MSMLVSENAGCPFKFWGWLEEGLQHFEVHTGAPYLWYRYINTSPRNNSVESSLVYPEGVNSPDWALLIGLQAKLRTTCRHRRVTLGTWMSLELGRDMYLGFGQRLLAYSIQGLQFTALSFEHAGFSVGA